jgi:hypothetical protein
MTQDNWFADPKSNKSTQTKVEIRFPPVTLPEGATPAMVGWVDGIGPWYLKKAEGSLKVEDGDRCAIDFPHHTSGQIAALLEGQEVPLDTLEIRDGELGANDIDAIASAAPRHLILGHERGEKGFGETAVSFVDGANLSNLRLTILTVSGIPFTNALLDTLGAPIALGSLTVDTTGVSLKAIARFRGLQILHVAGMAIDSESLCSIESLVSLSSIGIRNTDLTDDHLPFLASFSGLQVLDIAYNPNVGKNLESLTRAQQVYWIDLSTTAVSNDSLGPLGRLPSLQRLALQCTAVTDSGLSELQDLPLTYLNLAGTAVTDDGLAALVEDHPTLRTLDLRATGVTRNGISKLVPKLPNLFELGVSGDVLDRDMGIHLSDHSSLEQLRICPPMDGDGWIEAADCIGAARWGGMPA